MGYPFEEHETATTLHGYQGDERSQVANIIVRRKHVGAASNDIGFHKRKDGKYDLVISEFDQRSKSRIFLNKFHQSYVVKQSTRQLKKKGYKIKKKKVEQDGTIELRFA